MQFITRFYTSTSWNLSGMKLIRMFYDYDTNNGLLYSSHVCHSVIGSWR